jgi:hypothetical protein
VNGFVGVAVGGDIVEEAVCRGDIILGGVRLVGGELTDCGEEGMVRPSALL